MNPQVLGIRNRGVRFLRNPEGFLGIRNRGGPIRRELGIWGSDSLPPLSPSSYLQVTVALSKPGGVLAPVSAFTIGLKRDLGWFQISAEIDARALAVVRPLAADVETYRTPLRKHDFSNFHGNPSRISNFQRTGGTPYLP